MSFRYCGNQLYHYMWILIVPGPIKRICVERRALRVGIWIGVDPNWSISLDKMSPNSNLWYYWPKLIYSILGHVFLSYGGVLWCSRCTCPTHRHQVNQRWSDRVWFDLKIQVESRFEQKCKNLLPVWSFSNTF